MPFELAAVETEIEQTVERAVVLRKRDDTVADVSRRQHAPFLTQPAGAAAFVRDGDHRGDIPRESLQAAEQCGQSRAAADGDDARPQREPVFEGVRHYAVALGGPFP
ncbi:hypothetical protein SDC9_101394 [bioreactor metagenome]|uniref:Uncharacterized protein n=1 Tax=bioreactor metagenome TaxID=1076179 RepID=A0A645AN15_9ZZZZ